MNNNSPLVHLLFQAKWPNPAFMKLNFRNIEINDFQHTLKV